MNIRPLGWSLLMIHEKLNLPENFFKMGVSVGVNVIVSFLLLFWFIFIFELLMFLFLDSSFLRITCTSKVLCVCRDRSSNEKHGNSLFNRLHGSVCCATSFRLIMRYSCILPKHILQGPSRS